MNQPTRPVNLFKLNKFDGSWITRHDPQTCNLNGSNGSTHTTIREHVTWTQKQNPNAIIQFIPTIQKANQTHNPTNFRLLKLKRAKKPTNFTDPIHESYIRNIPNQEDATSGKVGERASEWRVGERVTEAEVERLAASGRESDKGRVGRQQAISTGWRTQRLEVQRTKVYTLNFELWSAKTEEWREEANWPRGAVAL